MATETEQRHEFEVGDFIWASWGYDQTNIDYAKIVEVSETGKTVVCQMTTVKMMEEWLPRESKCYDMLIPHRPFGDRFRLRVRRFDDGRLYFAGSYPFIDGKRDMGMRRDCFWLWDGKAKGETRAEYGH